jgi:NDP-sugar pyrophosphorylase family protein
MQLCAWKNFTTGEEKISRKYSEGKELAFSGISVVNKSIFQKITETGKFSITNLYLRLAKTEKIYGFVHSGIWADLGSIEKLKAAKKLL